MSPAGPEAKADDYVWCPECEAYHHKKFIVTITSIFDHKGTPHCPHGHKLSVPAKEESA